MLLKSLLIKHWSLAFLLHFWSFHLLLICSFSHSLQVSFSPSFQLSFLSYFFIVSLAEYICSHDFSHHYHPWPKVSTFSPNLFLSSSWISNYMLNIFTWCLLTPETLNTHKYELIYSPKSFPLDVPTSVNCTTVSQGTYLGATDHAWLFEVHDSTEIKCKILCLYYSYLTFSVESFRNFISFSKRSDIKKKKSLRIIAALLNLTSIFLLCILSLKKSHTYTHMLISSQFQMFRFWLHFLTIIYQNKLPVVGLVLLNNTE